jgi:hypothetical protein
MLPINNDGRIAATHEAPERINTQGMRAEAFCRADLLR